MSKSRADFFSAAEQRILLKVYQDYRAVITQKGNTLAITRARDMAWQEIADRLNASGVNTVKRTALQVKTKHKNIIQSAIKKRAEAQKASGVESRPPLSPPEDVALALSLHRGRPMVDGIIGGTSSEILPSSCREKYIQVTEDGSMQLLDPPQQSSNSASPNSYKTGKWRFDEEMLSGDGIPEDEDVSSVYKRHLLLKMEYHKLKMRKVQLEIKKLQKELGEDE
ncbi:uncharacterized protein LOC134451502 [Engraulis encrasicolus]|uniref:uncharacterized protein LOC134451502 n=1 Tax=Engraulis encrasicolus TaxID=184585 RepID=UPI002FD2C1E0